jgi:PIN domain nuclease of toxin-antitoxin system
VGDLHEGAAGGFPEAEVLAAQYSAVVETLRADDLVITPTDALRAGSLRWDHRDPFDRMLAAQALLSGVVFVTRDKAFSSLAGLDIVW